MTRWTAALLLTSLWAPASAAEQPLPRDVDFKVYRDGDEIGHHRVHFSSAGDHIVADTDIELAVTFAGVRMFHYTHRSREIWKDGALQAINSSTYDDGDDLSLAGTRAGDALNVQGTAYAGIAPATAVPTSYWFSDFVAHDTFLDTQSGRIFKGAIAKVGQEKIAVGGEEIEATHYTLTEALVMNLWYDAHGNWVKTSFEARGSDIEYVLQPPVERAADAR